MHMLCDRAGIPLYVAVSDANVHDSRALKALVKAIPAVRLWRGPRRCRPGKLHADKAYDQPELRLWIRRRGMAVRIARKRIESTERLGRHRWVIERTMSWLIGYHRRNPLRPQRNSLPVLPDAGLRAHLLREIDESEIGHVRHSPDGIGGRRCPACEPGVTATRLTFGCAMVVRRSVCLSTWLYGSIGYSLLKEIQCAMSLGL